MAVAPAGWEWRSGLGQGLGIALGVKLARPKQPVVTLIGDGAYLYNPAGQKIARYAQAVGLSNGTWASARCTGDVLEDMGPLGDNSPLVAQADNLGDLKRRTEERMIDHPEAPAQ